MDESKNQNSKKELYGCLGLIGAAFITGIFGVIVALPTLVPLFRPTSIPITPTLLTVPTNTLTTTATVNEISAIVSEPIEVRVSAIKGWQGTGIIIKVGDNVKIRHKEGLWQSTENEVLFGPDPNLTSDPIDKCFPLPSDPGALIGMIGNYEPFKVGYLYETISNVQGELFLRMNDCDHWLYNNRDELEGGVRVIVNLISNP